MIERQEADVRFRRCSAPTLPFAFGQKLMPTDHAHRELLSHIYTYIYIYTDAVIYLHVSVFSTHIYIYICTSEGM